MELLALDYLKNRKNLLAFSAGIDSTALFFLLLKKIEFDIAIVNYNLRKSSKDEVEYAKSLAKKYNKKIFIKETILKPPSIEQKAREIRYNFFTHIIKKENYHNLITAHQLNDNFEWLLMQLGKGSGAAELVGMEPVVKKNGFYIIRPLLLTTKDELLNYLNKNSIKYFIDSSNYDESFFRNYIRHQFSDKFLQEFKDGVRRSFKYLIEDKKILEKEFKIINLKQLFIAKSFKNDYQNIRVIDRVFKQLGYLLSSSQKDEILKQKEGVIAGKFAFYVKNYIMVSPYIKHKMKKEEKESLRKLKIPKLNRSYIAKEEIDINFLKKSIEKVLN